MPLYEYQCPQCKAVTEHLLARDCTVDPVCDKCVVTLERRISVPAPAQFRGNGFYQTDYKQKRK